MPTRRVLRLLLLTGLAVVALIVRQWAYVTTYKIPFLDVTPVLQERVESGESVYFTDDSHLNERGLAVVAETVANFLQDRAIQ